MIIQSKLSVYRTNSGSVEIPNNVSREAPICRGIQINLRKIHLENIHETQFSQFSFDREPTEHTSIIPLISESADSNSLSESEFKLTRVVQELSDISHDLQHFMAAAYAEKDHVTLLKALDPHLVRCYSVSWMNASYLHFSQVKIKN